MNGASATLIREFLSRDSRNVSASEMLTFWKSCTDAEKRQFTREAAELTPGVAIPA